MKQKLFKNVLNIDNPYKIFSTETKCQIDKKSRNNFKRPSSYGMSKSKDAPIRPFSAHYKPSLVFTTTSKSLKSVTLSSNIYGNYIDFYSNLTQKYSFKSPRVNDYPLLQYMEYLPIKNRPLTAENSHKDKVSFSTDVSNSLHLSYMKEKKSDKKFIRNKKYRFKSAVIKQDNTKNAENDFELLWQNNLFESKFLKKIKIKKTDMNNCLEEKQKNFKFFREYLKKINEIKDIFNQNNLYRSIKFNKKTEIKKENLKIKIGIYSLCLKFFSLSDGGKEKKSQKLYFPLPLMPLFYLLDFITFKVLLSEIVTFNEINNCFEYVNENIFINKINKYINYINNSFESNSNYINNIIYNKKEAFFPLIYDWIVVKNFFDEEEEENNINNNYRCYKLKIVLPKIKFSVDNLNIKINKFLNKYIIGYLLNDNFKNWEKYIFFDLFSSKRFRIITNLIMLSKYNEIPIKKIQLNKKYRIKNKEYEFFMTQIGQNYSLFYTFIPFIVLILFGKREKKFQKINLNLKESINLFIFGKCWGIINTLLKCMFLDKMKNEIFFKLDLLEDSDKTETYDDFKTIGKKSSIKNNNRPKISNLKTGININNSVKKVLAKNNKTGEKDKLLTKYKDKMFEISLINCTLRRINISANNKEEKFFSIPQNLLDDILNIKDENKIFDDNLKRVPLIGKYIGENNKSILFAKQSNIMSEEQNMMDDADIEVGVVEVKKEIPKKEQIQKQISFNPNTLNRLNLSKSTKINITPKKERKQEGKLKTINNVMNKNKRYSIKYNFPKGLSFARNDNRRVSIANSNELKVNRFENIVNDIKRRRTQKLKEYK